MDDSPRLAAFAAAFLLLASAGSSLTGVLGTGEALLGLDDDGAPDREHVIVRTQGPPDPVAESARDLGAEVVWTYDLIDGFSARVTEDQRRDLAEDPRVASISASKPVEPVLNNSVHDIQATDAWNESITGGNVSVAVLDTGIEQTDPAFEDAISACVSTVDGAVLPECDDTHGHGTHVSGIVASRHDDFKGVSHVADVAAVRVLHAAGAGTTADVIAGLEWVAENKDDVDPPIRAASLSLGSVDEGCGDGTSPEAEAADALVEAGVNVTVAAGNDGHEECTVDSFAAAEDVVTVGAADDRNTRDPADDTLADWSSGGPTEDGRLKPELVAPGANIWSVYLGPTIANLNGTSMAAPHVAGTVAMLAESEPGMTPAEVEDRLTSNTFAPENATDLPNNDWGHGLVDVNATLGLGTNASGNGSSTNGGDGPPGEDRGDGDDQGPPENQSRGDNRSDEGGDGDDGSRDGGERDGGDRGNRSDQAPDGSEPSAAAGAVVAHVDTGVNPYHEVYRDDSPRAREHPSTYIDGYPEDAEALNLTLDASSWREAFEADRDEWANLSRGQLYWIPGTKIVGAISFGDGGTFCPALSPPPANVAQDPDPPENDTECTETTILDDHGHGTMTSTRMAGDDGSLCPDCRIVSIEGLGDQQVAWAANQTWIDAQTNSWGFLVGDPGLAAFDEVFGFGIRENIETAASEQLVYFASGNGFGGFFGFTPWPTHLQPTHLEGVVSVGAHDNGKNAHWQGTPPHVVADGFRPVAADNRNLTGVGPTPFACCTSASSPYAAGEGARLVMEAREILGDDSWGRTVADDETVYAAGTPPDDVDSGPLADGELNLTELRELVKDTAQPLPAEGKHDGLLHWLGQPGPPGPEVQRWGPGDNAYCPGCWTLPVEWKTIPDDAPAYTIVGYGGVNEFSLANATDVLEADSEKPEREDADRFFDTYRESARPFHHPEDPAG